MSQMSEKTIDYLLGIRHMMERAGVSRSTVNAWMDRGVKLADGSTLRLATEVYMANGRRKVRQSVFDRFVADLIAARREKRTLQQATAGRRKARPPEPIMSDTAEGW